MAPKTPPSVTSCIAVTSGWRFSSPAAIKASLRDEVDKRILLPVQESPSQVFDGLSPENSEPKFPHWTTHSFSSPKPHRPPGRLKKRAPRCGEQSKSRYRRRRWSNFDLLQNRCVRL